MFQNKFNRNPFNYQVEVVRIMTTLPNRVVGMFRPTGDGKTLAMEGCMWTLGGITLFHAPTVTLAEFQSKRFANDGFDVINLEDIKSNNDAQALKNYVKKIDEVKGTSVRKKLIQKQRCIIVFSPSSFADPEFKWNEYFIVLAKKGMVRLIVIDECHLTTLHGKIFRQQEYKCFL